MNDNHIRVGDASTAGAPDSARRGQARPSVRARVTAPAAAIAVRRNRPPLPVRQWRPRGSSARGTRSALTAIDHRLLAPGPPASRSTTELTTNPSRKTHHDQDCPHRRHRRRPVSRRAAISARRRRARPARPASSRRSTNSRPTATPSSSTKSAPPRPTSAPWPRSVPARPTAGRIPEHPEPRTTSTPPSPARPFSSTSPAEQPRPPGGHLSSVLPGGYRVVVPSGRLRPPQGVLGHNSGAAPIIPVIADAVERPPTEHVTPIRQARPTS